MGNHGSSQSCPALTAVAGDGKPTIKTFTGGNNSNATQQYPTIFSGHVIINAMKSMFTATSDDYINKQIKGQGAEIINTNGYNFSATSCGGQKYGINMSLFYAHQTVQFPTQMTDTDYYVLLSCAGFSNGQWVGLAYGNKTTAGFDIFATINQIIPTDTYARGNTTRPCYEPLVHWIAISTNFKEDLSDYIQFCSVSQNVATGGFNDDGSPKDSCLSKDGIPAIISNIEVQFTANLKSTAALFGSFTNDYAGSNFQTGTFMNYHTIQTGGKYQITLALQNTALTNSLSSMANGNWGNFGSYNLKIPPWSNFNVNWYGIIVSSAINSHPVLGKYINMLSDTESPSPNMSTHSSLSNYTNGSYGLYIAYGSNCQFTFDDTAHNFCYFMPFKNRDKYTIPSELVKPVSIIPKLDNGYNYMYGIKTYLLVDPKDYSYRIYYFGAPLLTKANDASTQLDYGGGGGNITNHSLIVSNLSWLLNL